MTGTRKKRPCPYCPKRSFRSDNWKRHMNALHPGMAIDPPGRLQNPSQNLPVDDFSVRSPSASLTVNQTAEKIDPDHQLQNPSFRDERQETQAETCNENLTTENDSSSLSIQPSADEHVQRNVLENNLDMTFSPNAHQSDPQPIRENTTQCLLTDTILQFAEPGESDRMHILGCEQCWSKISRDIQSFHWLGECLIAAVKHGHLSLVKHLLNLRPIVDYRDGHGDTALHHAMDTTNIDTRIITLLCKQGSSVNIKNRDGETPLQSICCWSSEEREIATMRDLWPNIKALIDSGADLDLSGGDGVFTLHHFLMASLEIEAEDYLGYLEILASKVTDMNTREGSDALNVAVCNDEESAAEMLLKYGADPSIPDLFGMIPLALADSVAMAECLLNAWPESGVYSSPALSRSLEEHVEQGHYEIVELIVDWEPQLLPDYKANRQPLLHYTWTHSLYMEHEHYKTREVLLEAGYDPNRKDDEGNTAFHKFAGVQRFPLSPFTDDDHEWLTRESSLDEETIKSTSVGLWLSSAKLLKKYDAAINAINKKGESPLGILIGSLLEICIRQESIYGFGKRLSTKVSDIAIIDSAIHSLKALGSLLTPWEKIVFEKDMESHGGRDFLSDFMVSTIESCGVMDSEIFEDRIVYE